MEEQKPNHYDCASGYDCKKQISGLFLGLCFIIGCIIISQTFYKVKQLDNTLSVTGSTKQKVVSDTVKWVSGFSRTVEMSNLKNGYA